MTSQAYILKYPRAETPCYICKFTEKDPIRLGEFMSDGDIQVHYYCVLLSTYNVQKGEDDQGFLGFLSKDIKHCEKKIRRKKCCYCNKTSANVKCQGRGCRRDFHLVCGILNGAICTFVDHFDSFCDLHTPYTSVHSGDEVSCSICQEKIKLVGKKDVSIIQAPCCKTGYFHRWCLARFAIIAGYFFKCPLCNNSDIFRKELPLRGVFIPNQDAAWETDPDAFENLTCRPTRCVVCLRHQESAETFFIYCDTCGSQGTHRECLGDDVTTFTCKECRAVIDKMERKKHLAVVKSEPNTPIVIEDENPTVIEDENPSAIMTEDEDVSALMTEDEDVSVVTTEDEDRTATMTEAESVSVLTTDGDDDEESDESSPGPERCYRCSSDPVRNQNRRKRRKHFAHPYKRPFSSESDVCSLVNRGNSDFINFIYKRINRNCVS